MCVFAVVRVGLRLVSLNLLVGLVRVNRLIAVRRTDLSSEEAASSTDSPALVGRKSVLFYLPVDDIGTLSLRDLH